jgi:hypothetical protein
MVQNAVSTVPGVGKVDVSVVWDPPWPPNHSAMIICSCNVLTDHDVRSTLSGAEGVRTAGEAADHGPPRRRLPHGPTDALERPG